MILAKTYPASKNLTNVFNELLNTFPSRWENEVSNSSTAPVNISETDKGFNLEFNAPGRNKEDFKIQVDKGLLTVSYEKKEQTQNGESKTIRQEYSVDSFKRSFTLHEKINSEAIEAKYENGILKVYVPKKEDVKIAPKQISIQ